MNKTKCSQCGAVSLDHKTVCPYCERFNGRSASGKAAMPSPKNSSPKYDSGFSFFPIILITGIVVVIAFVVYGLQESFYEVQTKDDGRIMQKTKQEADEIKAMKEADKIRTEKAYRERDRLKSSFDTQKQQEDIQRSIQPKLDEMQKENEKMRRRGFK